MPKDYCAKDQITALCLAFAVNNKDDKIALYVTG